jgi:hypothetical protein
MGMPTRLVKPYTTGAEPNTAAQKDTVEMVDGGWGRTISATEFAWAGNDDTNSDAEILVAFRGVDHTFGWYGHTHWLSALTGYSAATLNGGGTVSLHLHFNEPVDVTGSPRINVSVSDSVLLEHDYTSAAGSDSWNDEGKDGNILLDGTDGSGGNAGSAILSEFDAALPYSGSRIYNSFHCSYASGTGTSTLTFTSAAFSANNFVLNQQLHIGPSALILNGGFIKDAGASNNANITPTLQDKGYFEGHNSGGNRNVRSEIWEEGARVHIKA